MTESRRNSLMRRLELNGAADLTNQELVELLLLYSSKRNDTEEATARLFDYFGSMSEVLEAPIIEMINFEGVSRNSAVLLSMIPQLARRIRMDQDKRNKIRGMDAVKEFVPKCFIGMTVEHFLLICLDKRQRMLRHDYISKGTVYSSAVDIRKIVHLLLATNARYAVVAHNHPRGNDYPSKDDLKTTKVIVNALKVIDVELLDHIIVNSNGAYSIADAPPGIRCCMNPD